MQGEGLLPKHKIYKERERMNLKDVFNVFSQRNKKSTEVVDRLTKESRNRIILILRNKIDQYGWIEFCTEIHKMFQIKLGKFKLCDNIKIRDTSEDIINYVLVCKDEDFLDFIEYIFKTRSINKISPDKNILVDEINEIFQFDDIKFRLTKYIEEWKKEIASDGIFRGSMVTTIDFITYPQIIKREDEFSYTEIMEPTLALLSDGRFKTANNEFLSALQDYKEQRYEECLTKCVSAYESVLKILCDIKKWPFEKEKKKQNPTLNPLLEFVIEKADLGKFLQNVLCGPAAIRNNLGSSHGKGIDSNKKATKSIARYQLNSTAAAILFIFENLL